MARLITEVARRFSQRNGNSPSLVRSGAMARSARVSPRPALRFARRRFHQRDPNFARAGVRQLDSAGQRGQLRRAAVAPVEQCIRRRHASRPALFGVTGDVPQIADGPLGMFARQVGQRRRAGLTCQRRQVPAARLAPRARSCPAPRPAARLSNGNQTPQRRPTARTPRREKGTRRGPESPHGQRQPAARPGFAPGGQGVSPWGPLRETRREGLWPMDGPFVPPKRGRADSARVRRLRGWPRKPVTPPPPGALGTARPMAPCWRGSGAPGRCGAAGGCGRGA